MNTHTLRHKHAGNNWVMVQKVRDDYCRIAMLGKDELDDRAYLAHNDMLTIEGPIPEESMPKVIALREALKRGTLQVKSSHIIPNDFSRD